MRGIWVIFRKEMGSYFTSPIAYIMLTTYTLVVGAFFSIFLYAAIHTNPFEMHQHTVNVNDVIQNLLGWSGVVSIFFVPLITMRLFSEEKRTGTMELLATSPVRDAEIILGKWLAACAFYGCLVLAGSLNLIFVIVYSHPDWKPVLVGYLGLFLLTGCVMAFGTFISSLTRNQIIAAVITFVAYVAFWLVGEFGNMGSSTLSTVLSYLAINSHFSSFIKGVVEIKDIVYYVTFTFLSLFLTDRYLESLRWRA